MEELYEIAANGRGERKTTIEDGACTNCGGNVMTKWKYGSPETACMNCDH